MTDTPTISELDGIRQIAYQIHEAHCHFGSECQWTYPEMKQLDQALQAHIDLKEKEARKHEAADIHNAGIKLLSKDRDATLGQLLTVIEGTHGKDPILHVYGRHNQLKDNKKDK